MTTRLVIMADTHLPKRAKALPAELWQAVEAADVVIHAGDWVEPELVDELEARSAVLLACYGNNDGPEISGRLPLVAEAVIEQLNFAVVHETGSKQGREARMDRQFGGGFLRDVLVFGHSHIPWDTSTESGMRLLNPGSPTDRRREPHCTYMTATVDGANLEVELRRLPAAGT